MIPIIYLPKPTSTIPNNHFLKPLKGIEKRTLGEDDFGQEIKEIASIASFCKHYVGVLEKSPIGKEIYAFHNEQEWRYVPSDLPIRWNFYNSKLDSDYKSKLIKKENLNKRIKRKLDFDLWKDVTFVVVKSEKYVDRIIDIFEQRKKTELAKFPANKNEIKQHFRYLCSCIITTDQLCSGL